MIIQDVIITTADGKTFEFKGVAKKRIQPLTTDVAIMDFFSPLDTAMGIVALAPGMVIRYENSTAVTSQIDAESGMLPKRSEADDMALLKETE